MSLATLIANAVGSRRATAESVSSPNGTEPDLSAAPPDSRRLIRDGRYGQVLAHPESVVFDEVSTRCAWQMLEHKMAFVPAGRVVLDCPWVSCHDGVFTIESVQGEAISVAEMYLDRHCVTNAQYARFVDNGGYQDPQYWPAEMLPLLLRFVDTTGHQGPRFWIDGRPPQNLLNHPVVGICWHEANAYARWAGKRLPSALQWQHAASWFDQSDPADSCRYPWGHAFEPQRANLWSSGQRQTVAVDAFADGDTPNGIAQLIGNVWEWTDTELTFEADAQTSVRGNETLAEVRGGAFDTYFASQATCRFRSGHPMTYRAANVGFRCCLESAALPVA